MEVEDRIIATVTLHDQPPVDTPAKITREHGIFKPDTTLKDVEQWAVDLRDSLGDWTSIISIEIRRASYIPKVHVEIDNPEAIK